MRRDANNFVFCVSASAQFSWHAARRVYQARVDRGVDDAARAGVGSVGVVGGGRR